MVTLSEAYRFLEVPSFFSDWNPVSFSYAKKRDAGIFAKVYRLREGFTKAEFAELQARISTSDDIKYYCRCEKLVEPFNCSISTLV